MMDLYSFKEIEEKYVPQIAAIEANTFSEPWNEEGIAISLNNELYNFYLMVDDSDSVVGYVGCNTCVPETEIFTVAIRADKRGLHLSEKIVGYAIKCERSKGVDAFFLEVRESNIVARNLYKKMGFVENGRRENFYSKPREAAILMCLT